MTTADVLREARAGCLRGWWGQAIEVAAHTNVQACSEALRLARRAFGDLRAIDPEGRTQAEVLEALSKAIELAEGQA